MKEKIGLFFMSLCCCVVAIFAMAGGVLLFHVIIDGIAAALGPWWLCGLLFGLALGYSIYLYRKMLVEEYPELARDRRYYIVNYDEFLRDSRGRVLEFKTKEAATVFLDKMDAYIDASMGYGVVAHLMISEEVVDATNMNPSVIFNN